MVPILRETLVNGQGQAVSVPLVGLSKCFGYFTFRWLWGPLGMPLADWHSGASRRLPLMEELVSAIVAPRRKRKRFGGWVDENDRPVPTLLQIQVRGHSLQAGSDHRWLKVNLSAEEDMQWFLGELWKDLHPAPGELLPLAGPAVQAALVSVQPAEVVPEGLLALRLQSQKSLEEAIKSSRVRLSGHESARHVAWDKANGRFKLRRKGLPDVYASVLVFKMLDKRRLLAQDAETLDACLALIMDALAAAVVSGESKLRS